MFEELEPKKPSVIRFHANGDILISSKFFNQFFKNTKFIKLYFDEDNKKVGLKPSDEGGYKLFRKGGAWYVCCRQLSLILRGDFGAEWSKEKEMLIISYEE